MKTEKQCTEVYARVEKLLKVADYDEGLFSAKVSSLVDVIKLRMYEMGLTQAKLSGLLHVSLSRVRECLSGKCVPTLNGACEIG